MTTFLRDHWQPQTILWTDASVAGHHRLGGTAVVRHSDGAVLHSQRHRGKSISPVALERVALLEAIRIARRLVHSGQGPVEVRTDCRMALHGVQLRCTDEGHVRALWQGRDHNIAHDAAQSAMLDGEPSDALDSLHAAA